MPQKSAKLSLKSSVKKAASGAKARAKKASTKLRLPRLKLPKVALRIRPDTVRPKLTESDLINAESALGGTIFGKIPAGHRREFFRFKDNVWIFHENWTESGKTLESTITYEVKETGVFKSPLGKEYVKITGAELDNFLAAARAYLKIIKRELY